MLLLRRRWRGTDAGKHQYPIPTGNITRQHIYVVYIKGPINPNMKKDTRPPPLPPTISLDVFNAESRHKS